MDAVYRHFNKTVLFLATALLMVVPGRADGLPSFVMNGSGAANLPIQLFAFQASAVTVASSMSGTTEISFTATVNYGSDQAWLCALPASATTQTTLYIQICRSGTIMNPAVITLTATSPAGVADATITVTYPNGGGSGGPTITTTSLPYGIVGVPYSTTLSATNGTPPYTWTANSIFGLVSKKCNGRRGPVNASGCELTGV